MKNIKKVIVPLMSLSFLIGTPMTGMTKDMPDHMMMTPADLKWVDAKALPPGAKVAVIQGPLNEAVPFVMRVKFPANYKVPSHTHPTGETLTVLSGQFNLGFGDKLDESKTHPLKPGSVAMMQPTANHFATTKEETIIQLHGMGPFAVIYANPADDPRKK
jgi:quercetin dioxygenase-like cupin family protein